MSYDIVSDVISDVISNVIYDVMPEEDVLTNITDIMIDDRSRTGQKCMT